jgi:hypothetical protein
MIIKMEVQINWFSKLTLNSDDECMSSVKFQSISLPEQIILFLLH